MSPGCKAQTAGRPASAPATAFHSSACGTRHSHELRRSFIICACPADATHSSWPPATQGQRTTGALPVAMSATGVATQASSTSSRLVPSAGLTMTVRVCGLELHVDICSWSCCMDWHRAWLCESCASCVELAGTERSCVCMRRQLHLHQPWCALLGCACVSLTADVNTSVLTASAPGYIHLIADAQPHCMR